LQSTTVDRSGQQMENEAIQESRKSEITALSEQHKVEIAAFQDKLQLTSAALSKQHEKEIAAVQSEKATLSEQNKKAIAAITEDMKLEMTALFEQNKMEFAAIQDKLNTMIQEKERLQSAKSLDSPKRAKIEAEAARGKDEAAQAKHDRICNLMMKRKEFETAGFSAIEIDERMPFPQQDDDE
jgi:hypothetical protein